MCYYIAFLAQFIPDLMRGTLVHFIATQMTDFMKKFLFISGILACTLSYAQEPSDALRFAYTVPSGTARQQAIGGAMGSLGGDITATFINPAGLGFYKTGDFVFSPSVRFGKNKASFLSRTEKDNQKKI